MLNQIGMLTSALVELKLGPLQNHAIPSLYSLYHLFTHKRSSWCTQHGYIASGLKPAFPKAGSHGETLPGVAWLLAAPPTWTPAPRLHLHPLHYSHLEALITGSPASSHWAWFHLLHLVK